MLTYFSTVYVTLYILIGCFENSHVMVFMKMTHQNCINNVYPFSKIERLHRSIEQIPWSNKFLNYDPPEYDSESLLNKTWADPPLDDISFKPKWNQLDGTVNRKSYVGNYEICGGRPLNPQGRTGLKGRGILGKWGPNHAADPIVSRWKMLHNEIVFNSISKLPVLQFCAIQRKDNGEWAIPGGMVDPGEQITDTLKREFLEEALDSLESSQEEYQRNRTIIETFFKTGDVIYQGYVDDPRNTDNAWIETVAVNYHDHNGVSVGKIELKAGDDAQYVKWLDVDRTLNLYASHSSFLKAVVKKLKAHW